MRTIFSKFKPKKKKINWKSGSAELIGIGLAMPVLCLMIIAVVGIMQTGIMRQALEYATYMSARAAVSCETAEEAQRQAEATCLMTMEDNSFGVETEDVDVDLQLVGGTSSTNGGITWEKGALVKCQVTVPFKSLISFSETNMTSIIYMMVERPARTYY